MVKLFQIVVLSVFLFINNTFAQKINQRLINNNNGEEILIGVCTKQAFQQQPFSDWFISEYNLYRNICDKAVTDSLKKYLPKCKIEVVLATWCSDSRQHFPHFMCIKDICNLPDSSLTIICVDREKLAPDVQLTDKKIDFVPTFIVYYKGKEIGRIIETPEENLEKHLLKIVQKI